MASKRDKKLEIKSLKEAVHILACSNRDKKIMISEVPEAEGKITVIPNCVDINDYGNYLKPKNFGNNFKVLFVGLLSYPPNKDAINNICNIIAANCGKNVEFIIVGKNPPIIKNKPKNVKFLGYVNDLKNVFLNQMFALHLLDMAVGQDSKY